MGSALQRAKKKHHLDVLKNSPEVTIVPNISIEKTLAEQFKEARFKNLSHTFKGTLEDLKNEVAILLNPETNQMSKDYSVEAFIATDSHNHGGKTVFACVLAIHWVGKYAKVYYTRFSEPKKRFHLKRQRLLREGEYSVAFANEIADWIYHHGIEVVIHADINTKENTLSYEVLKEMAGYITACGFKSEFKPDAFAATYAADRLSR